MTTKAETTALAEMHAYQKTNFTMLKTLGADLKELKEAHYKGIKATNDRIQSLENTRSIFIGFNRILLAVALVVFTGYSTAYFTSAKKTTHETHEENIDTK